MIKILHVINMNIDKSIQKNFSFFGTLTRIDRTFSFVARY
jgi:hypothetical protein